MTVELLVAGGGCAGLTLGHQLAQTELPFEVSIFETRSSYERDRTWCQWKTTSHPFEDCIVHEWPKWCVKQDGINIHQRSATHPYQMIDANLFYQKTTQSIQQDSRIQLLTDCPVQAIEFDNASARVKTDAKEFVGDWLVETRPSAGTDKGLKQHFLGYELQLDKPVFNPDEVILMDFSTGNENGIQFVYVLPFSKTNGLVEATWISSCLHELEVYEQKLNEYIHNELNVNQFDQLYEEHGVIPLMNAFTPNQTNPRKITIGTPGGATRPSTGYTFIGIQNQVNQLLSDLSSGQLTSGSIAGWSTVDLALDAPLVQLIEERPNTARNALLDLFDGTSGNQIARFLMGVPTPGDMFSVLCSMPKKPMVQYAIKSLLRS